MAKSERTPEEIWASFLKKLPPHVAEVVREYPATTCYRSIENEGHYWIYSYGEPPTKDGIVTVKIVHGRDSYLPGVMVFGVQIGSLVKCGCGKWESPTEEQFMERRVHIEEHHEALGRCAGCTLGSPYRHRLDCKRSN